MLTVARVAIIGAGPLGRRLAGLSAQAGYETTLEDVLPSALRQAEAELRGGTAGRTTATPVHYAASIEDAVRTADLIIDCVPDELESKLEIFSLLDRMAPPHAILGTPTATLSIADLASCTYRAERCVAFELSPALLGAGELREDAAAIVVRTPETLLEVCAAVEQFWNRLGFPVLSRIDPAAASLPG